MDTSDMTSLLVMSGYSQKSLRFERHAFEILGNWRLGKMRFWNPPRVFGRALVFSVLLFFGGGQVLKPMTAINIPPAPWSPSALWTPLFPIPRPPVVPSFRRWDWGGCQEGPVIPNLRRHDWRCRVCIFHPRSTRTPW